MTALQELYRRAGDATVYGFDSRTGRCGIVEAGAKWPGEYDYAAVEGDEKWTRVRPREEGGSCPKCGAKVIWAVTPSDKNIPLEPEPNRNGRVVLRNGRACTLRKGERAGDGESRYFAHFAICPEVQRRK